ncbi:MAG: branched-chain amino acid ABC transporter permease [Alphaproteobacteria bacterium]|nr:branched-chain amino acid ABC transporter permease [Alphaproteobacteria bacterium]
MTAEAAPQDAAARPKRRFRITYVDVILWSLRILVLVVVVGGTIGTLIKGRYTIEQWFDFVMFGLTIGGIYALIALGYTMVYGILRLINFAHGDITMTGAFSGFFLAQHLDRTGFLDAQPVLAMLAIMTLAMVVCTVIALAVERICYRPFRHVATLAPLICAIGASFFLQHSFRGLYGSTIRSYPDPEWLKGAFEIAGFRIPLVQPMVIGTALAAMLMLYLVVQRTKMGTAMRAVSEDRDAAAMMGIDVNKVITFTFILGGCMAGIGGVLYAMVYKQVYFYMGFLPGIKAFSAAVLGGIGNIPGAMIGGFVLGIVESVGPALFLDGIGIKAPYQLRDLIAFTMLVMVLIFRPQGILGERLAAKRA